MSTFEIVSGVEGNCLVLDGTRICGPKPWGGGRIVKTFRTDGIYEAINKDELERLKDENAKLRLLLEGLAHCHKGNPHETCPLYRDTDDHSRFENWCRRNELAREFGVDAFDE